MHVCQRKNEHVFIYLMAALNLVDGVYRTKRRPAPWYACAFPSITFYCRFLKMLLRASAVARRGRYDEQHWVADSINVLRELENVGVEFEITGFRHFENLEPPCLFIGNHMSSLESTVLPGLIQPYRRVTFVVKSTLPKYPIFGHVIRARDPILVDRSNPRKDLKVMLEEGLARLNQGISIVIFPQATRMRHFDPAHFNKIGVKLAARAKVPIIPIALQTDAWETGIFDTDLGRIIPSRRVRIAFGAPLWVQSRGHREHQSICEFIGQNLRAWRAMS